MRPAKILIITDQADQARTWVPSLQQKGWETRITHAHHLPTPDTINQHPVILLDGYAPSFDLAALCHTLRTHFHKVILAVTYERDEPYHVQLYHAGVDEVIVKPLGVPYFLAKMAVWVRHVDQVVDSPEQFGSAHFSFDPNRKRVTFANGKVLRLSTQESALLALLMRNSGQVLEPDLLIDRIWRIDGEDDPSLLKNLIYRLRRKLEADPIMPSYIHTVSGYGYTFRAD